MAVRTAGPRSRLEFHRTVHRDFAQGLVRLALVSPACSLSQEDRAESAQITSPGNAGFLLLHGARDYQVRWMMNLLHHRIVPDKRGADSAPAEHQGWRSEDRTPLGESSAEPGRHGPQEPQRCGETLCGQGRRPSSPARLQLPARSRQAPDQAQVALQLRGAKARHGRPWDPAWVEPPSAFQQ